MFTTRSFKEESVLTVVESTLEQWKERIGRQPRYTPEAKASEDLLNSFKALDMKNVYISNAHALTQACKKAKTRTGLELKVAKMAFARALFDCVAPEIFRKHSINPNHGSILFEMFMHASQGIKLNCIPDREVVNIRKELEKRLKEKHYTLTI
jgi:hypothetical protein